jgi:hypothetical protein
MNGNSFQQPLKEQQMKRTSIVLILLFSFLLTASAFALTADVSIRINGALPNGLPQMYAGQDNILQIWFTNSAKLKGFSLGLEFDNGGQPYSVVSPYGNVPQGSEIMQEHGVANNFLSTFGDGNLAVRFGLDGCGGPLPNVLFWGGADGNPGQTKNLLAHLTSTLGYSIKIRIPTGQPSGTFCVRPVFVPRAGAWLMDASVNIDLITGLPSGATNPNFQGVPTVSSDDPGIPFGPACFVIAGDGPTLTFNPAFDVCPAGDAPFRVTIKDGLGSPIVGDTAIRITLENCGGVHTCSSPSLPSTLYPIGPSDANGQVSFYTSGLNCGGTCQAVIRRKTQVYGTIPVRSFDADGDSIVSVDDLDAPSMCNDYNGNNEIDFNDHALFTQHLSHRCAATPDPCDRFGYHFILDPGANLDSGRLINISLAISNNNPSLTCNIGIINFYETPFGTGGAETFLYSMPYNHTFQPGEQDTTPTFQYKIPNWGARCLKARFTPSCCGSEIAALECYDAKRPCLPDGMYCYNFKIALTAPTTRCVRKVFPNPLGGWQVIDLRPGGFPANGTSGPDSIDYMICTPINPQLGDTASSEIYVVESSGKTWPFRNRVVVTSNTGDANGDCYVNISDAVYIITYIFAGGTPPVPYQAGDVNCDTSVNISDAVYLITYIFVGGAPPCLVY